MRDSNMQALFFHAPCVTNATEIATIVCEKPFGGAYSPLSVPLMSFDIYHLSTVVFLKQSHCHYSSVHELY